VKDRILKFSPLVRYGALIGVAVAFYLAWLIATEWIEQWQDAAALIFFFVAPVILLGLLCFYRHLGHVRLTKNEIVLERGWQRTSIPYQEINYIKEGDFHIPPNLIIYTTKDILKFSSQVEEYDLILATLQEKRDPKKWFVQTLPWEVKPHRWYYLEITLAHLLFLLPVLAMLGYGAFIEGIDWSDMERVMTFLAVTAISIAGLGAIYFMLMADIMYNKPYFVMVFHQDHIEGRTLWGSKRKWPLEDLQEIRYGMAMRYPRYGDPHIDGGSVEFIFKDGETITLPSGTIRKRELSGERLFMGLRYIYKGKVHFRQRRKIDTISRF
jgi:hypothetical protein